MKTGFTLIELLAVIVILAIIAIIAVPIVLNIINDSKESSLLRSAEFYLDAVEYTVADAFLYHGGLPDGEYPITNDGDICKDSLINNECLEENTLKVEVSGDKPESGTITIESGNISNISLVLDGKTIVKNGAGELVYQDGATLASLCDYQETEVAEKTVGAKYECDFGTGKRNFYILELGSKKVDGSLLKDDEVALILEGNYDTTTQAWCNQNGENSEYNVCAADGLTPKLNEIREAWKSKLNAKQIVLPSALQIIVANDPTKNTIEHTEGIKSWLYNWNNAIWGDMVFGYYTSTPYMYSSSAAWYVSYNGFVDYCGVEGSGMAVRPVINLKL